jgi:hypothetical protein
MLTDIETRKAKPQERPYKLTNGKGLYLLVTPTGGKHWRINYRHGGKQKTIALGNYPDVTLAKANDRRGALCLYGGALSKPAHERGDYPGFTDRDGLRAGQ